MYGHVITKFSGMGRFTYPWCSAGALRAPELRYYFFGYESLSKGYNVLNEFMFQSHLRFCRMQWSATRFYGSLS